MKRRVFLKNGAITVGLVSTPSLFLKAAEDPGKKPSQFSGGVQEEIRSTKYLNQVRADKYLPKAPVFAKSKQTSAI